MKNEKYWKKRDKQEQEWIKQNLKNDAEFNKELQVYFDNCIEQINKEIKAEINTLANRLNLDLSDTLDKISEMDVKAYSAEAKKIVKEAEKKRKAGKYVSYSDYTKEINDRLKLYNATMRINRLEYVKSKIGLKLVELGLNIDDMLRVKLSDDYIKELKRQAGILAEQAQGKVWTSKEVAEIVMSQTKNATFSQRLWKDIDTLKAQLDLTLTKSTVTGASPQKMAKELLKLVKMDVENRRYIAERLARTESARVQFEAQKKSIIDNGYKECKWHQEPGACATCQEIASFNNGVYAIDKVPSIPAHPNCRCSISAF